MSESAESGMGQRMRNALGRGATRFVPSEVMEDEVYRTLQQNPEMLGTRTPSDNGSAVIAGEYDTIDKREEQARANHRADFPWLFEPVRGVRWDFDPILLRNLAQEAVWVGMLVQSITKEIAQTPWTITSPETNLETAKRLKKTPFERDVNDEAQDPVVNEIVTLLSNPNPDHDWTDLVTMWMADLLEIGSMTGIKAFPETAWETDTNGDQQLAINDPQDVKPMAIQPSAPEVWTKEYQDRTGILSGYWQFDRERNAASGQTERGRSGRNMGKTPTRFDRLEVIWSDHAPRSNRRYGMAPTLLVKDFLKLLDLTVEQEQQYFSKGSVPSGAWVFENYDRKEAKEWKEENEENIKGKPHKVLFLGGNGGDVRFEPMSMNYQELQFMERMQWYARVIASVFQVPTAVVGIEPEKINYSTFQGERGNFESNTLGPYLQKIERVINNQVVWPHWGRNYQFEFQPGMSEERRAMISDRIRSEWDRNLITRNKALRQLGYEEVDDEEDGYKDDVVDDAAPEDELEMFSVEDETGQQREVADGESVRNVMGRDSGNVSRSSEESRESPDDPLRESGGQAQLFSIQPSDIEALHEEIADDVAELADEILTDSDLEAFIEEFADDEPDEDEDTVERAHSKSLNDITRRLQEMLEDSNIVGNIQDAIEEHREEAIQNAVERATSQTGEDVDMSAITQRVADRSVAFAADFADRMEDEIRQTVADGWDEGKSTLEISDEIEDKAGEFSGWGAEKIARQELQVSAGEARSEFASQTDRVEQWITAGDNRVRGPHDEMDGMWKHPHEDWSVDYSDVGRGVQRESTPGDSEPGIGCRCTTLLLERNEVNSDDHAGI